MEQKHNNFVLNDILREQKQKFLLLIFHSWNKNR